MYPEKYLDSYKINKIIYKDNDIEKTVDKDYKLEAIFYKNLSTFDDWQKVSKTVAENYILTNDIDVTGKSRINTGVAFNRLETSTDETTFSLKGINLEYKTNGSYYGLISKVVTSIKNIGFEDITITNSSTAGNSFNNIMIYNYGIMSGVKFNNVTIDAPKKNFTSPIGDNFGTTIQNITIKDINITGNQYSSGFIARTGNSMTDKVDNINGENITINANSHYTGGLFGFFQNSINNQEIRVYTNLNVKDSNITSKGNYTGEKKVTFKIYPGKVTGQKVSSSEKTSLKIKWDKVSGVTGYKIYRSTSKNGTYKCVATVSSKNNTYTNTGLITGTTYYYKIRAYKTVGNENIYGSYSTIFSGKTKGLSQVKNLKQTVAEKTSVKLSWSKVSDASGYRVYRSTSKDGTYKLVADLSGSSKTSYTNKNLSPGKTYYYKVRAYKKVGSNRDYGSYSSKLNASTKCNAPVISTA